MQASRGVYEGVTSGRPPHREGSPRRTAWPFNGVPRSGPARPASHRRARGFRSGARAERPVPGGPASAAPYPASAPPAGRARLRPERLRRRLPAPEALAQWHGPGASVARLRGEGRKRQLSVAASRPGLPAFQADRATFGDVVEPALRASWFHSWLRTGASPSRFLIPGRMTRVRERRSRCGGCPEHRGRPLHSGQGDRIRDFRASNGDSQTRFGPISPSRDAEGGQDWGSRGFVYG